MIRKSWLFAIFAVVVCMPVARAAFDCGAGYVLAKHTKVDGIIAAECQKLWCRDLENGKTMGNAKSASAGYVDTASPMELCAADGTCVECFGDRKWCSGEVAGVWNPEYGAYTRGGNDNATYQSYQKGSCFAWRLEKPQCADGLDAILQGDEWVCAIRSENTDASRASGVRRTGTTRRIGIMR